MNIRKVSILITLLLGAALSGCASSFSAIYDYDREHDFSDHQKWAWISEHPMTVGESANMPSPLLEPRIMSAIESDLFAKGFDRVENPEDADFVIAFTVGSREKIKVDSYPTYYGGYAYPTRWGGPYYGGAYGMGMATETRVREYTQGRIAVDIFDVSDRIPVWHGVAEKSITDSDRKNAEETINAAVSAVMAGYPPGAEDS